MSLPTLPHDFELPPHLKAMLAEEPSTEKLVSGRVNGEPQVGLVLKRSYKVGADGHCEPAPDAEQELVVDETLLYHELEAPRVSPVVYDNDLAAFRPSTDLVVQGYAQSYGEIVDRTTVALAIGDWRREIRVHGNRRAEWHEGRLRFTPPEPFEIFPIRYDYAYGGYDERAVRSYRNPLLESMKKSRSGFEPERHTPFHYPRNPSGKGYLMRADEESAALVEVPNLEFPSDPVTPERLAVGDPDNWLQAPLPAGTDWFHPGWFPRIAYMGMAPLPESRREERVPEIEYGWAPNDLLQIPSFLKQTDGLRPEFVQAASPGLSFPQVDLRWEIVLENWHPEHPSWRVRLPEEVPEVRLGLGLGVETPLTPHLSAIVIRPEMDHVVMTWCASAPTQRAYSADQAEQIDRSVDWRRGA